MPDIISLHMSLKSRKMLFVSANLVIQKTGAGVCSKRNLEVCRNVFGEKNLTAYSLSPFSLEGMSYGKKLYCIIRSILYALQGYSNGSNPKNTSRIVDYIKKYHIDYVFIDSSLNGRLVERIKENTKACVISFFHNCEKEMLKQRVNSGNLLSKFRYNVVCANEKKSTLLSDKIIALNQRDVDLINSNYGRVADLVLPISLTDRLDEKDIQNMPMGKRKKGLFVGSYFFGNIEGLTYFIREILPFVNMDLVIVGRGMSKLKANYPNVAIYDGVNSLDQFYLEADFVLAPIVSGGGMKVKIAEAMMYGKVIIGTSEAFEGYYDIPKSCICNTSSAFIEAINSLSGNKYNSDVREYFLQNYETSALTTHFRSLFQQ